MKEQISCSALCSLFAEDACCGAERKDTCMAAGDGVCVISPWWCLWQEIVYLYGNQRGWMGKKMSIIHK